MAHGRTGLTDKIKEKILHFDRLSPEVRKNVAFDVRAIVDKELEDLEWILTEMPEAFRRMRDRQVYYPLEVIIPADPKRIYLTLDKLKAWREAIKLLEDTIAELGLRYMKRGRL